MIRLFCDRCHQEITGKDYDQYMAVGGRPDTTNCGDCAEKINRFNLWREERREQIFQTAEEKYLAEEKAMRKRIFGAAKT